LAGYKTTFNEQWTDNTVCPNLAAWIQPVPNDPYMAKCKWCSAFINLSNMGRQALTSHSKGKKHLNNATRYQDANVTTITQFLNVQIPLHDEQSSKVESGTLAKTSTSPSASSTVAVSETSVAGESVMEQNESVKPSIGNILTAPAVLTNSRKVTAFMSRDNVTKAEILWAMKMVRSHFSYRSSDDMKNLFQSMFPDSSIANQLSVGRTKISYIISFGLAPYLHQALIDNVKQSEEITVCFDEALNKIAQRGQMDVHIRYWDADKHAVMSRYLTSTFMNRATAEDIVQKFTDAISEIPCERMLQMSMDGPSVNWKFLDLYNIVFQEYHDGNKLLEVGSCGLHIVHGSLQHGHKAAGWSVNSRLRALHNLFKDSPARRAQFTSVTSSTLFPLKFCQVRWVENNKVANRALIVLPHVKKYVSSAKLPSTVTSESIKELCSDPLAPAKIAFFASVAAVLEPFLVKYQTSAPLVPFLYDDLIALLRSVMTRYIKKDLLDKAKTGKVILNLWNCGPLCEKC
jgi:hypothetical protein